ncbi:aldo/keto reductase [Tautonia plasticadhaerens]|uniref:L-glyceraldehyde 3-phosphate reductase n=1 Tax=Tautonia plasticadhaerens TaxID=2527974 RepID=A0A518H9E8_9BACT|nr:aldo/keto reductase [Tautonia plasticadhaerens]QDV37471.1 L-glyceraldehyde 3-phosphate reductase [Tautonia plasticadhaerens]
MSRPDPDRTDRRSFLQAGAIASAAALSTSAAGANPPAQDPPAAAPGATIPKRALGKAGVEVTMLDQGAIRGPSYDRILRYAFASGIRMFDTAKVYGTEPNLRRWFEQDPEVRKEIFLITKDMPKAPSQLLSMLDERLEALGTDYIDLFFIHGLGDDHSLDDAVNMVVSDEFKQTAEAIRKSGKARFVGFSSHHKDRATIIQKAAEAGYVDAIMLQYRPWLPADSALNRALDTCWEKGIGLISMKQIAGQFFGDKPEGNILDDVSRRVPTLKERNLSPFQGLLHAIWSDERITSVCCSMRNTEQIRENVDAARRFEPLEAADLGLLRDATLAHGPTLCANCDGRCSDAGGTRADLGTLTRYLTYYRHLGDRSEARRQYALLPPEARDWSGADLDSARAACPERLDFARLLPGVDRDLG